METLRQVFGSLGFSNVETFIASGNVVFETSPMDTKTLERMIEIRLSDILGFNAGPFIRTEAEIKDITSFQPAFPSFRYAAAEAFIIFLADTLNEILEQSVNTLTTNHDAFYARGREIYWLRTLQSSGLPFSTVPLEKTLRQPFTIRGARTIKKMVLKYAASQ